MLDEMQKGVSGHKIKLHHGKQTLRQLMKHNTGVSNIEITGQNIWTFSATAKKYDFELMTQNTIALMDGSKRILHLQDIRPFFSDKLDITCHPHYIYLDDADKKKQL